MQRNRIVANFDKCPFFAPVRSLGPRTRVRSLGLCTLILLDRWTGVLTFLSALLVAFILIYQNVLTSFDLTQNYSVKQQQQQQMLHAITICRISCAIPFQWRVCTRLFALCVFLIWRFFFSAALVGIPNNGGDIQTRTKKKKSNFLTLFTGRSVACIRWFVLSCNEHVHQIFYSMIPFAFMLVAYCMRYLVSLLYPGSSDNKHTLFRIIHSFFFPLSVCLLIWQPRFLYNFFFRFWSFFWRYVWFVFVALSFRMPESVNSAIKFHCRMPFWIHCF